MVKTIGEVLSSEGFVRGTPEWQQRAAEILCGKEEWERLESMTAGTVRQELDSNLLQRTYS